MMREWALQRELRERGTATEPDLGRLWAHQHIALCRLGRDPSDRWMVTQPLASSVRGKEPRDFYSEGVRALGGVNAMLDLRRRTFGAIIPTAADERVREKTTVWVPLDLRYSIADQFSTMVRRLREMQSDLLRLSGRAKVQRIDPDIIWRNLYCYVLATKAHMTSRAIARNVFPGEKEGAVKVRNILTNVRRALKRHDAPVDPPA